MFGPIDLIQRAAADAALAEALYRDRSFLSELREGKDVLRTFSVTTLPPADGRSRRAIPAAWRLRVDPMRPRPVL